METGRAALLALALATPCVTALPWAVQRSTQPLACMDEGPCSLPQSQQGTLLRLLRTPAAGGAAIAAARSYDGHDWEGVFPAPAAVTCAGGACSFPWDAATAGSYEVETVHVTAPSGTTHATAHLLSQGTFGTTRSSLEAFDAAGGEDPAAAGAWFDAQVAAEPTLVRQYLRVRSNPRMSSAMQGDAYEPCDVGSRWHAFAFNHNDAGKTLTVSTNGDVTTLALDGDALAEVTDFPLADGTYEVCEVDERAGPGGDVTLAPAGGCGSGTVVPNPVIAFAAAAAAGTGVLTVANGAPAYAPLAEVGGVVILQTNGGAVCPPASGALYFLHDGDAWYRFDRRLKLVANTVEAPTSAVAAAVTPGNLCPAAAVNFLNQDRCVRDAGCGGGAPACGSRAEVANDPNLGNRYTMRPPNDQMSTGEAMDGLDQRYHIHLGKQMPFHNVAWRAEDQLRQRVAWALFQAIPVGQDLGRTHEMGAWSHYLDIFVQHAFGNYFDVLKEVSYNPLMGLYLTFERNSAFDYDGRLPDQNYAREVMQLFSIGLHAMRMDGTPVLEGGERVETYTNRDVVSLARVWTGFRQPATRGNGETAGSNVVDPMYIDASHRDVLPKTDLTGGYLGDGYPLCKDLPPQHFLQKGAEYIYSGASSVEGVHHDEYAAPAFEDLTPLNDTSGEPVRVVMAGAAYCASWSYCGSASNTGLVMYKAPVAAANDVHVGSWHGHREAFIVGLEGPGAGNSHKIYHVNHIAHRGNTLIWRPFLFNNPNWGPAEFEADLAVFSAKFPPGTRIGVYNAPPGEAPSAPQQYTPSSSSPLYAALCAPGAGLSCTFPRSVTLTAALACPADDAVCTSADDLTTVKIVDGATVRYYTYARPTCVNFAVPTATKTAVAGANSLDYQCLDAEVPQAGAVCCIPGETVPVRFARPPQCLVLGDRMTQASAKARCAAAGLELCSGVTGNMGAQGWQIPCSDKQWTWVDAPCSIQVQVNAEGLVNLVSAGDHRSIMQMGSQNTFYPRWAAGYPTAGASGCVTQADGTLLCDAAASEAAVFGAVPTRAAAEAELRIGAFDPETFGGAYACALPEGCDGADVVAFTRGGVFDASAVVGLRQPAGGYKYWANKRAEVAVGGFVFRNAPGFMSMLQLGGWAKWKPQFKGPAAFYGARDAAVETDALLLHLLHHSNAPPFVAKMLINRLVTSNPSPRYIETVATAFAAGSFHGRGSGRYGCLHATVAAVLLDREARSTTLLAEPTHGGVQEPFLKLFKILRGMELGLADGHTEVLMSDLARKIGQDAFETPSVFGFFDAHYSPKGAVHDAGLVAPEAMLFTTTELFGLFNGVRALVQKGLGDNSWEGVLGSHDGGFAMSGQDLVGALTFDPVPAATGYPDAQLASEIVDSLDAVLTGGRLSAASKAAVLAGMTIYEDPVVEDLDACTHMGSIRGGYTLEKHCHSCTSGAPCSRADVCRASDGTWHWSPPRGCIMVSGFPYSAMASDPTQPCCSQPDAASARATATRLAVELIMLAPEFHTSALRLPMGTTRAPPAADAPANNAGYKAVVAIMLEGGADSWNFLVPSNDASKCDAPLSYAHYAEVREAAALPLHRVQGYPIAVNRSEQPCSEFYISGDLDNVKDMWDAGDAAFFANMGNLIEPMDKFNKHEKEHPPHVHAHNVARRHMQTAHAQYASANGILGKMADALKGTAVTNVYTLDGYTRIAEGDEVPATVLSYNGLVEMATRVTRGAELVDRMYNETSGSVFAEHYGAMLQTSIAKADELRAMLDAQGSLATWFPNTRVGRQLREVAQMVKLRRADGTRLADRDAFSIRVGGFDTHSSFDNARAREVDEALRAFKAEMVAQGEWSDVTVVTMSDFGRTLKSNGQGTDHAWGGHYFAVGGSVKDQAILGKYPPALDSTSAMDNGHSTVIPSVGYEAMWGPILEWYGVPEAAWDAVLPNLRNFPPTGRGDLFD